METLKPLFADGLRKALAVVNAAKSNEAFKKEECMLSGYWCAATIDIIRIFSVVVNGKEEMTLHEDAAVWPVFIVCFSSQAFHSRHSLTYKDSKTVRPDMTLTTLPVRHPVAGRMGIFSCTFLASTIDPQDLFESYRSRA